jgi:hypothetical protein
VLPIRRSTRLALALPLGSMLLVAASAGCSVHGTVGPVVTQVRQPQATTSNPRAGSGDIATVVHGGDMVVHLRGSGDLLYSGEARITSLDVSGSGSVRQLDSRGD